MVTGEGEDGAREGAGAGAGEGSSEGAAFGDMDAAGSVLKGRDKTFWASPPSFPSPMRARAAGSRPLMPVAIG